MGGVLAVRKRSGSSLLSEFNSTLDSLSAAADNRGDAVRERIAELEVELADLRQLERKLEAAVVTA